MVGKWHLGYMKKEYTPTHRGFDSHLGYFSGYIGYYDHTVLDTTNLANNPVYFGLDFRNGTEILKDQHGKYATHVFTETAEQIIRNHNTSKPLFLYLAHLATHAGNLFKPAEAPPEIISKFKYIKNFYRRIHAGGDPHELGLIDGFDMWNTLLEDSASPRTDMLQNLDPIQGTSAFRLRDLKLVNGTTGTAYDFWHGPSGSEGFSDPSIFEWVFKNGSVVADVLKEMGLWIVEDPFDVYQRLRIKCQKPPPKDAYIACQADKNPCLFNITADPCEYKNIADQHPEVVRRMMDIINMYKAESMEPQAKPSDPRGDPMCHQFVVVPWLDPEYYNECDFALGSTLQKEDR
ncbi:unnamed protein product [Larinioides sclopetarius]|uniref:Sulfatase N-terminal domain-containing protein n=1 Tax=Larinioides sclopetarius TaxID=280406 RepID=A0AAV2C266_9ARAC